MIAVGIQKTDKDTIAVFNHLILPSTATFPENKTLSV